jgi:scyllo-inosose 3-dehydrogenase
MLPMITKEVALDAVPDNVVLLRTDKKESKISCVRPGA